MPTWQSSVNFRPPEGGAGTVWRGRRQSRPRPRLVAGCGLPARDRTSAPRLDGAPRPSLGAEPRSALAGPLGCLLPGCVSWPCSLCSAWVQVDSVGECGVACAHCHRRAAWVCDSASLSGALGVRLVTGAGARAALAWARGGRRSRGPGPGPARGWWQESLPGLAVVATWLWPGCQLGQVAAGPEGRLSGACRPEAGEPAGSAAAVGIWSGCAVSAASSAQTRAAAGGLGGQSRPGLRLLGRPRGGGGGGFCAGSPKALFLFNVRVSLHTCSCFYFSVFEVSLCLDVSLAISLSLYMLCAL